MWKCFVFQGILGFGVELECGYFMRNFVEFEDFWVEFEIMLKNRVDVGIFDGGILVEMECGEVWKVLINWWIWRVGIGMLKKYQCSRWFKNNSLIVKAFILYTILKLRTWINAMHLENSIKTGNKIAWNRLVWYNWVVKNN